MEPNFSKKEALRLFTPKQRLIRCLDPIFRAVDDIVAAVQPDLIQTNSVNLIITGDCNIHCIYCEYPTRYHGLKEFTTQEWKDLILEMKASGINAFSILGGEPLLRPDWADIVDACLPSEVWLVTNGTFINEKIADKIAQRFPKIRISLDASNEATYEAVRRNKRFSHVLQGIKLLLERGINIELSYVIIDRNVSDIENTANLAQSLGVTITYSIVGFENNNQTATEDRGLIDGIDKMEMVRQLKNAVRKGSYVSISRKIIEYLLDEYPPRCYSSGDGVMVDGLGKVYPCCGPTPPIGDLKKESWATIKTRHDASWEIYRQKKAKGCNRCNAAVMDYGFFKAALKKLR